MMAHGDDVGGMRPKDHFVADARETLNYIASRAVNQRLPTMRTTMRLDDGFERDEQLAMGDEPIEEDFRRVRFAWKP